MLMAVAGQPSAASRIVASSAPSGLMTVEIALSSSSKTPGAVPTQHPDPMQASRSTWMRAILPGMVFLLPIELQTGNPFSSPGRRFLRFRNHLHPVAGPEGEARLHDDGMARHEVQPVALRHGGDGQLHLHHRERLSDALPGP